MTARAAFLEQLVTVTLDEVRGLALVAGRAPATRAAHLCSPDDTPPRWSTTGRGWVVPYAVGLDVTGWAQATRTPCRVVEVTP